jgi:hypothetical protein
MLSILVRWMPQRQSATNEGSNLQLGNLNQFNSIFITLPQINFQGSRAIAQNQEQIRGTSLRLKQQCSPWICAINRSPFRFVQVCNCEPSSSQMRHCRRQLSCGNSASSINSAIESGKITSDIWVNKQIIKINLKGSAKKFLAMPGKRSIATVQAGRSPLPVCFSI